MYQQLMKIVFTPIDSKEKYVNGILCSLCGLRHETHKIRQINYILDLLHNFRNIAPFSYGY
jgi:hypothetical protein